MVQGLPPPLLVEHEIDFLKEIVKAIQIMPEDARVRTFKYLKDRYAKEWPSDTY